MKVNYNEFLAVAYSDLFDYPLTVEEMKSWSLSLDLNKSNSNLHQYGNYIQNKGGYFFLKGRERIVELRNKRKQISERKLVKLTSTINLIKKIPTVCGIFVTGSVAVLNAKEEADLDLMIVTSAGCVWMTRLVLVGMLRILGEYRGNSGNQRNLVCTNIFLDLDNLEVRWKNLYSAHEVLQAKCLYDRGQVEKMWLNKNKWVKNYLPNAYKNKTLIKEKRWDIFWPIVVPLELFAFVLQYFYMKGKITNEKIGFRFAFFHPNDLSKIVLEKYNLKIRKLLHISGKIG